MARDDYYTIVAKILVFLYKKLKKKDDRAVMDYIVPLSKDFPVDEEYLQYVLEKMSERGLVERIKITKAWGGDVAYMDYSKMRITPEGIDYMLENRTLRKVAEGLKEAAGIASLFNPLG